MNNEGNELLEEIKEVYEKIEFTINKQLSEKEAFHKTILNIKDYFFDGLYPKTSNRSVKFYTANISIIDDVLENISDDIIGIYFFTIKIKDIEEFGSFRMDWGSFKQNNEFKTPALRNRDTYYKFPKKKFPSRYVLYIGKSEHISQRIKDHIKGGSNSTSCLQLEEFRNSASREYDIEVGWLYSENRDTIPLLYPIEKFLHKHFLPLLGSSR